MRLAIKVHDQTKGPNGWSFMFITFDGVSRLDEIDQAEVKIAINPERDIIMQHDVIFKRDMKSTVTTENEGNMQSVRYKRTGTARLEPIQINKDSLANSENDGASAFSTNDSLSTGRPESTADTMETTGFQQVRINGEYKKSYYRRGDPYRYYKSTSRGTEFFFKKSYLKPAEVFENDPGYYRKIIDIATGEGHHENGLTENDFNRFAEHAAKKVPDRKPMIILTNDNRTLASSKGSGSSKPRSPLEDASVVSQTEQTWSDYHINPIQKYASG